MAEAAVIDESGWLHMVANALSVLTIGSCLFLKVPQILQVQERKSARGIYIQAMLMEIFGYDSLFIGCVLFSSLSVALLLVGFFVDCPFGDTLCYAFFMLCYVLALLSIGFFLTYILSRIFPPRISP